MVWHGHQPSFHAYGRLTNLLNSEFSSLNSVRKVVLFFTPVVLACQCSWLYPSLCSCLANQKLFFCNFCSWKWLVRVGRQMTMAMMIIDVGDASFSFQNKNRPYKMVSIILCTIRPILSLLFSSTLLPDSNLAWVSVFCSGTLSIVWPQIPLTSFQSNIKIVNGLIFLTRKPMGIF